MKITKIKGFSLVVLLLMLDLLLFSLDPQKQLTQYIHKKWFTDDGLPNNSISSILQTSDGYLWIGTDKGLVRFDGAKFKPFNKENIPEIKDNRITVLYEDSQQTLWAGTRGGLIKFKNGVFKSLVKSSHLNQNNGLLHDVIHALLEDGQGNLWIGYQGQGMSILKKGSPLTLSHPEALAKILVVNAICRDKQNPEIFWLGTINGVFLLKEGKLEEFPVKLKNGEPIGAILAMICSEEGDIWLGTDKNGVIHLRFNPKTQQWLTTTYDMQSGLKFNYINTVFMDREKNLWIGTEGGGLHRLYHNKISVFTEEDGLSNDSVNCIYEDREGNLWVGTLSGLNLFMNGKFTTYTEREGLLDNVTWTIYEDRQKRLWITTNEGLNCFQKGRFTSFTRKDGLCSDFVSCTWEDREGFLWIGTYDRGLNLLKDGVFTYVGLEQGLKALSIRAVYEDSRGNVWVGAYGSGLFKKPYREDTFISFSTENGLSNDYIFAIYEDQRGGMWIGTDGGGLNHLVDNHITVYTKANGLSSNTIFSILEDREKGREGTLWLGTEDGGLNYFKNGKIIPITLKDGLSDNTIYQIIDDENGFFWMGGHRGVSRVMKQDLYDFTARKIPRVTTRLFGKADGIKGDECSGSFQPAGWRTSDGNIWFPTTQGAVCLDPDHIQINVIAPPVHIEKVLLDGKPGQWQDSLTLAPNIKKIEIHYTALSLSEPRNVRFRYILEGFETEWVSPRDRKDRIVTYTNLPPGRFVFRLTACNNDGIWNKDGISLNISVLYPFWQQWWFIALALIGFSLVSYAVLSGLKHLFKMIDFWRKKNYIGAYRIIRQIGSGGMANIFEVVSAKRSKKHYLALKLMKEEYIFDEIYRKRFLDEGRIIDSLDHPHIVKVFERGEHNNNPFIAMELLEGQTLDRLMQQRGLLSLQESLDITLQIIDALSAIHRVGIIHRDLKPGNLMIIEKEGEENFVKILDFGLAKTQSLSRVTESGLVVGTLSYLSPEQLLNSEYSTASDIYAVGVIFYEMLTGEKPYKGETPLEIMQQMLKTHLVEPRVLRKDIPPQLNSLILNMLDKKPGNRPNTEILRITLEKLITNFDPDLSGSGQC